MKVIMRSFDPVKDSGLIYDSYPKGVYFGSLSPIEESKTDWMKRFYETVKKQLLSAHVRIACTEDDTDTILGYSIIENGVLQFVYVKSEFRNKGIGTLLTRGKFEKLNEENLTKVGAKVFCKQRSSLETENGKTGE